MMMMMMKKKFPGVYMTKFRSIPSTYINHKFPCTNQLMKPYKDGWKGLFTKKKGKYQNQKS